jgi:hypothetical protein
VVGAKVARALASLFDSLLALLGTEDENEDEDDDEEEEEEDGEEERTAAADTAKLWSYLH